MVRGVKHTEIGDIPADWEIQTFDETFRVLSNNTLSRAELNNSEGSVRNVHYGDILVRFSEVLDCGNETIPYLNDAGQITANAQFLKDGDIVLADTAEDETVGKATEIYGLGDGKMLAGLHTIPCRVKKGAFAAKWLGYYMNSHVYHEQMLPYITGIKVSSISKSAIEETLILVPPKPEQEAIAAALSDVDALIADSEKVIAKYRMIKQACLERMFPREGQTEPEMRMPGFTGSWEKNNLGELAETCYGGGTPNTSNTDFWNGEIPWIQSSDLTEHELFGVQPKKHISNMGLMSSAAKLVPGNSLAIITRVGVGKLAVMPFSYATSQDFLSLSNLKKDICFSAYATYKMLQDGLDAVQGTSIKGITKDELLARKLSIPSYEEQKQIGAYFKHFDDLITLHQRKLKKYQMIKQGMMDELLTGKTRLI